MDISSFSQSQKKELCLTILSKVRERGGIFQELYDLILSGEASDQEYNNIYSAAMTVLKETDQLNIEKSLLLLQESKERIKIQRENEMKERFLDESSANSIINNIF